MSDFNPAFQYVMQWEDDGLTGKVTVDAGGRTRFGISENSNPGLPDGFWTDPIKVAILTAKQVYLSKYFLPNHLDQILNQELADYLLDCIVNPGAVFVRQIQALAANISGQQLALDGTIGPLTRKAINACSVSRLLEQICESRILHYKDNASNAYLNGLVRRAEGWQRLLNPVTDVELA